MNVKVRAIITGATGMVGEGVLHECLIYCLANASFGFAPIPVRAINIPVLCTWDALNDT